MLRIRSDQFQTLEKLILVPELRIWVQKEMLDLVNELGDEEVQRRIDYAIDRCRSFGATRLQSYQTFVALALYVAPDFNRHLAVVRVLEDELYSPDKRISRLISECSDDVWNECAEASTWSVHLTERESSDA